MLHIVRIHIFPQRCTGVVVERVYNRTIFRQIENMVKDLPHEGVYAFLVRENGEYEIEKLFKSHRPFLPEAMARHGA